MLPIPRCIDSIPPCRILKRFTRIRSRCVLHKEPPFLARRSADILICPPVPDNVHSDAAILSCALSFLRCEYVCAQDTTVRTSQSEVPGVISMECLGRLDSKKSGRVSSMSFFLGRMLSSFLCRLLNFPE